MNEASAHAIDHMAASALIEPLTELVIRAGAAILAVNRAAMRVDGKTDGSPVTEADLAADRIIGEVNNGGDLIESLLRTIDATVSYKAVHATRGKRVRAEPISSLYEQGKVLHVQMFPELEDQLCNFVPDNLDSSPDRLDALVWALTDLMLDAPGPWEFL